MSCFWTSTQILQKARYLTFINNNKDSRIYLLLPKGNKNCYWKFKKKYY